MIDATELGLPQTRKRHVLIACKGGAADIQAAVRALKRPLRPLRWAIEDLMDAESDDPLDRPAALSAENARRIAYLFDNDEYNLPDRLRPDSRKGGHAYPAIYGRLKWDAPAGTITTGFSSPRTRALYTPRAAQNPHPARGGADSGLLRPIPVQAGQRRIPNQNRAGEDDRRRRPAAHRLRRRRRRPRRAERQTRERPARIGGLGRADIGARGCPSPQSRGRRANARMTGWGRGNDGV